MKYESNLKADLDKAGNKVKPKKDDMEYAKADPSNKRRKTLEEAYNKLVDDKDLG